MTPPDLRLLLSNRPQNVALVRQALGGLAGAVGLDDGLLADVKTASCRLRHGPAASFERRSARRAFMMKAAIEERRSG